ncbi:hypothetical protein BGZ61DRAFT_74182 [Ilyonectria robusta]|uniref:uncharacterized protein n=1 Tax=Ilyonectria robusta TaxID=1079257 RepID=UPI001E8CBB54|nr:uncharacterized protein BGZ61DRAFT_74182 [Ilyonectria robusta]KAH8677065.1 hypothetical protein BGZ61DRAFT_74182 [Ilyonectria robusta]
MCDGTWVWGFVLALVSCLLAFKSQAKGLHEQFHRDITISTLAMKSAMLSSLIEFSLHCLCRYSPPDRVLGGFLASCNSSIDSSDAVFANNRGTHLAPYRRHIARCNRAVAHLPLFSSFVSVILSLDWLPAISNVLIHRQ